MKLRSAAWPTLLVAGLAALWTGCGREEITTYQTPKEKEPVTTATPAATAAAPQMANPSKPPISWKLPAGWEELPPGDMRVGYFHIQGKDKQHAQMTIIPLAGMAGGDLDNVNRWRSQVGLTAVTPEQMAKLQEKVDIGGEAGQVFDMIGTPPEETNTVRMIVAKAMHAGTTWFFKMTGDDELVKQQKPTCIAFLKSVSFQRAAASSSSASPSQPVAAQPPSQTTAPTSTPATAKPTWKVPANWQEQAPGAMQTAKFGVGSPGKAEVTVAAFPGEVGGIHANVNRWRSQVGLPAVDLAGLKDLTNAIDLGGVKATVVDLAGPAGANRLVVVLVSRAGQTWFYKLLGDPATVGPAKETFLEFVKSAK